MTPKPVRCLIYTHWHFDHNNGGIAYREAFPDVAMVSQRDNARYIEVNGIWWSRMSTQSASARRAGWRGWRRRSRGVPTAVAMPSARTNWPCPANSPHDVTIWLSQDRVLFTGDILVHDPYPYTGASWPLPWGGVLREIEATPVAALVPGHGPVMRDHRYTRLVRELMEAVTARVDSAARRGLTLEQVQDSVTLEDFRTRWPADDPEGHREEWRAVMRILVECAWRGVRGQG